MARKQQTIFSLKLLMLMSSLALIACHSDGNKNSEKTAHHLNEQTKEMTNELNANSFHLRLLDLSQIGNAKIVSSGEKLLIINDKSELWNVDDNQPLASNVLADIEPVSNFGKIAFADGDGYFNLIENGKQYVSKIKLSPNSGLLLLPLATIAVIEENNKTFLARIERQDETLQVVARSQMAVLPDARPIQINFAGDNREGHIAILSHPDDKTYRHGVLGDGVEALELQYLERHTLTPLAKPATIDGLVFEANRPEILPHKGGHYLVSTMSGKGDGARVVVIDKVGDALQIIAQSTPLPPNRWQSPFVLGDKLYAVQMPHFIGRLVEYKYAGNQLKETLLGEPYSNHKMGEFKTNHTAMTDNIAIIPTMDYQNIGILNKQGQLSHLPKSLPTDIKTIVAYDNQIYILLNDGRIQILTQTH